MSDNLKEEESPENLHNYVIKRSKFWIIPRANDTMVACLYSGAWLTSRIFYSLSDKKRQEIFLDKITARIQRLSYGLSEFVCPVSQIVIWQLVPARIDRNQHGRFPFGAKLQTNSTNLRQINANRTSFLYSF